MSDEPEPYLVMTDRLQLRRVVHADLDALYDLNSDPAVWRHLPTGRHTDPGVTRGRIAGSRAVAERLGLHDYGLRPEPWQGEPMHAYADREPAF